MEDFEIKIKELLQRYKHIKPDDWYNLSFALFLEYQREVILKKT